MADRESLNRSLADRETSDAEASRFDHDDGTGFEVVGAGGEVGEKQRGLLFGATLGAASEEHEGRLSFLLEREDGSEVGVGGNHDALLGACAFDDRVVCGGVEVVVADVDGVVAFVGKSFSDARRERVVDQKSQCDAASGSSRSRTASAA